MKQSAMPARKRPMNRGRPRLRVPRDEPMPDPLEVAFREDVHRRSLGWCELCQRMPSAQIHHRRTREEKWSKWLPDNGLDLCRACHHDVIHANVDWARRHWLILSRHSTTHPKPVLVCAVACEIDHRV